MPQNGLVRGNFCSCGTHTHTQAGVQGMFRAWDSAGVTHINGIGEHPTHSLHFPPPGTHAHTLDHVHSMNASKETLINDFPPILETDTGCWECCCCDGDIFEFVIDKNSYEFYVEDKNVLVQGIDMISGLHDGTGKITNGGSGDTFVGVFKTCAESDG